MMHGNLSSKSPSNILSGFITGWLAFIIISLQPTEALAKSLAYKQGLHHYAKGEFDKAIDKFKIALRKKPKKSEKTNIYKYIGMSLFTLGRQAEAEKSFQQCLATDSKCSLIKKEALDESVLPFFQDVKRRFAEKDSESDPSEKDPKGRKKDKSRRDLDADEDIAVPASKEKFSESPSTRPSAASVRREPIELVQEPINFFHFMPLGIGQFYNGDYLLATVVLSVQVYAAGVIFTAQEDIDQAKANEVAAYQKAQTDSTISADDLRAFSQAKNSFVDQREDRTKLAAGVLIGTYAFGVLHALIMRPYVTPASVTGLQLLDDRTRRDLSSVHWQLSPTPDQGLRFDMHWDF